MDYQSDGINTDIEMKQTVKREGESGTNGNVCVLGGIVCIDSPPYHEYTDWK